MGKEPTEGPIERLERGREAFGRHDWQEAFDLLSCPGGSLGPDDLEALGDAADSLGRYEEGRGARERAYTAFLDSGDRGRAAGVAWRLFNDYARAGKQAIAGAWLGRARRLLEHEHDSPQRGRLLLVEAEAARGAADLDTAAEKAEAVVECGRRFGDRDLEALGLQALGRILIDRADVTEGLARLDEAMLAAVRGELGLDATGWVWCSMIAACHELGDLRRAAEWADAAGRWCEEERFSAYPGLCRAQRAELLGLGGAWEQAQREALRACDELLTVDPSVAGRAFYQIGDIRRRLGDFAGAEDAFRRADALGCEPQPGLALLRLAQGRVDAAGAAIRRALAAETGLRLARTKLLPAQVEIALAAGDLESARVAADELDAVADEYGSSRLRAAACLARGRVEIARHDAGSASRSLRRALIEWQGLSVPYEVATTRLLLGLAFRETSDEEAATSSFLAAAETFEGLGAYPDARRAAGLVGRGQAVALSGGLTEREAEVLRLVAAGKTNKEVAVDLHLSHKTVARHLSNIFTKLGVRSRAAATSFAVEHGITAGHPGGAATTSPRPDGSNDPERVT
jgi:DNA-binding CsgD family transcriptional regulator